MYKTKVIEIGELVPAFEEEKLVVLFGPEAPAELRSICVIHESDQPAEDVFKVGGKIYFGDQEYIITELGAAANQNFNELGHISIYFREGQNEVLPGAIIASPGNFPTISENDIITID